MRRYFLYIHPSSPPTSTPNKFLFRFKFSSLTIPRLLSFSLVFEIKFHFKVKVYTFLYAIINGNIIASFVEKRKVLGSCDERKDFCVCTQPWNSPSPLIRNWKHLAGPIPSPFVRTYYVDDPELKTYKSIIKKEEKE